MVEQPIIKSYIMIADDDDDNNEDDDWPECPKFASVSSFEEFPSHLLTGRFKHGIPIPRTSN